MSEWVVPVELETGVPLTIEPAEDGLPPAGLNGEGANWHHLVYPRTRKELSTDSGFAIRQVRTEWVDVEDHASFHHYFDQYMAEEWEFPKTINHRFGMTVLMAARYVPPMAIRIRREGPSYVSLDENQRQRMWNQGILRIAGEVAVYEFLRDYILDQNLSDVVNEDDISMFLTTKDSAQRATIGDQLLEAAAMAATESIKPVYLDAYKKRLMTPNTPAEPKELIISEPTLLGTDKRKRKARSALRKRLADQYGVDLADAA